MGDSGEGLVDAEARLQERMDERARERATATSRPVVDADRARTIESLRLARTELERQANSTQHPVRREQIAKAIEELDRRIAGA